jgi:acylphosphatase
MHYLHLRVHGRVQGVGYRHFIVVEAGRLGLHGMVRNLPNGEVEVIADGDRAVLERLVERARLGPAHAAVTDLHADWGEGPPRYSAFRIEAEPRSPR